MHFSQEEKNKIVQALQTKKVSGACSRCGETSWILADTYTSLSLQDYKGSIVLGGPNIPTAALICKNCGSVELHSTKILAGLPEEKKEAVDIQSINTNEGAK